MKRDDGWSNSHSPNHYRWVMLVICSEIQAFIGILLVTRIRPIADTRYRLLMLTNYFQHPLCRRVGDVCLEVQWRWKYIFGPNYNYVTKKHIPFEQSYSEHHFYLHFKYLLASSWYRVSGCLLLEYLIIATLFLFLSQKTQTLPFLYVSSLNKTAKDA